MHIEMEPMNRPETDHEGAMAKADLYKLANYSIKLFNLKIQTEQLKVLTKLKAPVYLVDLLLKDAKY